jgi:c-di-GMP-binding flagellar brake protein YcgR
MQYYTTVVKDVDSVLKVNQRVEVSFDHPDFLDECMTRIEKLSPVDIGISMPTRRRVPLETHCWVYFIYESQRYGFESTVRSYGEDNIPLMLLARPLEVLRLQRRKYFRVPVEIPVECILLGPKGEEEQGAVTGMILNISSGGVFMTASGSLEEGREVSLSFRLSPETVLSGIAGRILRVIEKTAAAETEYGIEFTDLSISLRDLIMRFAFSREIELNRMKNE